MSYQAKIIEVLISSPSDVDEERQIIRDVVADWNAANSRQLKTVLIPVGWDSHGAPDAGNRPQAHLNEQLVKSADLLIAIFWKRLGSPTGVEASGTVEEIKEHLAQNKPAMIYFSNADFPQKDFDADQFQALKIFKKSLQDKAYYQEYASAIEFRTKLSRQLAQTIYSKFNESSDMAEPIDASAIGPPPLLLPNPNSVRLIAEASKDKQGAVMSVRTMDGITVQTNGQNFVEPGNARSGALWRGIVADLARLGFLEDRSGKGEVYFVTDAGYRFAQTRVEQ